MTFDPFGDAKERGYLRNHAGLHDPAAVKEFEHRAFLDKLDEAVAKLAAAKELSYQDVLRTHKTLFEDAYPWAGQDRAQTAPNLAISKGEVLFAHPEQAQRAVEYALKLGNDAKTMADKPGEVMGHLAYGHPFLDGNGRTIMVVHSVLAQRAGVSIDWAATDKTEYLNALTKELDQPGKGNLDGYLKPFVREAVAPDRLAAELVKSPGLDGSQQADVNKVLGKTDEPALQERYRQQEINRETSLTEDRGRGGR